MIVSIILNITIKFCLNVKVNNMKLHVNNPLALTSV